MQTSLTTFLIKSDKKGQIVKVYWYQPVYFISPFQKHLSDLFNESDLNELDQLIREAIESKNILTKSTKLHLRSPNSKVSVRILSIENQLLIIGLDGDISTFEQADSHNEYIISEFMRNILASEGENTGKRESTIRMQFEQIQKLNNNLINTQRELSRVNAEINRLNSYLNNRLVKDELTGLVSRYQYREEIEICIRNQPNKFGIFTFIDIDNFKRINDTFGHRAGDDFLRIFSNRLQQIDFDNKICMRISGDEFGLYIHGFDSIEEVDVLNIWKDIEIRVLFEPAMIDGASIPVRLSAGMAVYGMDTIEIYELIEYADFAMYQAKKLGKNTFQRFDKNLYRQVKGL